MARSAKEERTWLSGTNSRRGAKPESGGETVSTELFWFVWNMLHDDEGVPVAVPDDEQGGVDDEEGGRARADRRGDLGTVDSSWASWHCGHARMDPQDNTAKS